MDRNAAPPRKRDETATDPGVPAPPVGQVTGDWSRTPAPGGGGPAAPPPPDLFGAYELLDEVARGGMGVVYKARQRGLDRVVALKMVLGADLGQSAAIERFLTEAKAAAALDHPNVVPVYDAGEIGGRVYFTMAYVDGPDLRRHVEDGGIPPLAAALRLFVGACAGVAHAHRHGIVHRDLKPANVLIDRDGRPRVTDFGLAKRSSRDSQLTGTGQIMGTPAYMAPEQAREAKDVGPAADVYSLGGVLYFLLTGRPPFEAASIADLLLKVMTEPPVPPTARIPTVPPEVEALCLRCLAKDPADRYADAQVLLEEAEAVAEPYLPRPAARQSGPLQIVTPRGSGPLDAPATLTAAPGPAPTPAAARPSRLPWVIGGVALVAAAAALAVTRPWERAADVAGASQTGTAWTLPARGDVPLTVRMETAAAREPSGALALSPGTGVIRLRLRADEDCSAMVLSIDTDGTITQLFPNDRDPDDKLKAKTDRLVPPVGDPYTIDAAPTEGTGLEVLRVIATTGPLAALPGEKRVGPFRQYPASADRRQVEDVLRKLTIGPPAAAERKVTVPRTADAEITYRVTPR